MRLYTHFGNCDGDSCKLIKALAIAVEALEKIRKDQAYASGIAFAALSQIEKMGEK